MRSKYLRSINFSREDQRNQQSEQLRGSYSGLMLASTWPYNMSLAVTACWPLTIYRRLSPSHPTMVVQIIVHNPCALTYLDTAFTVLRRPWQDGLHHVENLLECRAMNQPTWPLLEASSNPVGGQPLSWLDHCAPHTHRWPSWPGGQERYADRRRLQ
jgi:hypothetical protein